MVKARWQSTGVNRFFFFFKFKEYNFIDFRSYIKSEKLDFLIYFLLNFCRSGLLNFSAVALALSDLGYKAIGIRIDSGDLAYLSEVARNLFNQIAEKWSPLLFGWLTPRLKIFSTKLISFFDRRFNVPWFADLTIVASNDINEETIWSLNEQNHKIDCFGIGTSLGTVTRPSGRWFWFYENQNSDSGSRTVFFCSETPRYAKFEGSWLMWVKMCSKFFKNFVHVSSFFWLLDAKPWRPNPFANSQEKIFGAALLLEKFEKN